MRSAMGSGLSGLPVPTRPMGYYGFMDFVAKAIAQKKAA